MQFQFGQNMKTKKPMTTRRQRKENSANGVQVNMMAQDQTKRMFDDFGYVPADENTIV